MKTEKVVLIIVGVGVASVGGYMAWKKFAKPSQEVPSSTPVTVNKANLTKLLDQNAISKNGSSLIKKFVESKGKVLPLIAEPAPAAAPTTTKPIGVNRDDFGSDRFSNQQAIEGFNLF